MAVGLVDSRTKKARVLKLEDVYDNFQDYNFVIYTNMGTIDTSRYNVCNKVATTHMLGQQTANRYIFAHKIPDKAEVVKDNTTGIKINTTGFTSNDKASFDRYIELIDFNENSGSTPKQSINTVQRIEVKSKRNFLGNQTPRENTQKL